MACYYRDGDRIKDKGFLHGYDKYVWGVIVLQAGGGMVRDFNSFKHLI